LQIVGLLTGYWLLPTADSAFEALNLISKLLFPRVERKKIE
jgi:hypothetical protein